MPRSYTKIFDVIFDFYESDEKMMVVDVTPWKSAKVTTDCLRRVIKNKRFDNIMVVSRNGDVFLMKR